MAATPTTPTFSEAGGLKANDEVRVAGVRVGKVRGVELDGDHVRVEFQVDEAAEFGPETGAEIHVKTLLGAMYLGARAGGLRPDGGGQPRSRSSGRSRRTTSWRSSRGSPSAPSGSTPTSSPTALDTMAALTKNTPEEFQAALRGVSALSANVAARDEELNTLLRNLREGLRGARRP